MEYKIQVGKSITIKKGLVSNLKLLYGGMPNEQTFTVCPLVQNGNVGHSPNIYYDIYTVEIFIGEMTFYLIEVTPRYILITDNIDEANKEFV